MKTKRLILSLIILISISANSQFKRRAYNSRELNVSIKNEIGAEVYMQGEEDYQDAIKIIDCPEFKINFVKFPYNVGDVLPYFKNRKNYDLYFSPNQKDYLDSGTIGIAFDKEKNIYVPYIDSFNGFLTKDHKGKLTVENIIYTNSNCKDCFKKVFIYNGKAGNIVKFSYREFINDMARPAFTQELQYDLNDGKIVGFKGMQIEILNISNIEIEYIVLSSFN
ncbi:hypothetical protein SAMN05444395_11034 [Flavobacterium fryxellicola]|uniref:WG repeat-containing protein n=1 Tax=Flavobacterium fryxellicola TaxID=249352 RepID=A0A167ZEQ9_9FLAO|nr:hypothetical protein [Flavobacterium fryxellicola]OAB30372.1 hypothetical protein FBFR_02305 [Flavobacterium fryxellicola]SHN76073.1 hypothetical protein SAMN05444395_11034 [Flavobacterium fryxellicola]